MSDVAPDADIDVTDRKRVPVIWLLPIIAALVGLSMLYYDISNRGPKITIEFSTAEGIQAEKTKIKSRNVDLGVVESVTLKKDLEGVVVTAQLDPAARDFVNADAQFWVVRARVGAGGISGLGTLLSGGYIELAPGKSTEPRLAFVGLEEPPVTAVGTPGVRVELRSDRAGSLSAGDPVLYRGFTVGRVESSEFDIKRSLMRYHVFIDAPYNDLLTTTSRFWDQSGVNLSVTAQGFTMDTGSVESILGGGVEFDTSEEFGVGTAVQDETEFKLFASAEEAKKNPFEASLKYVLLFEQSLRGLNPGAPVEMRGIQIGQVERIMLEELSAIGIMESGLGIPVLIRLEPGRLRWGDNEAGIERMRETLPQGAMQSNLYATLQTGNLLTGQLVVAFEFFPDDEPGKMGTYAGYPTLPTKSTGLIQIEQKVVAVLDNLQSIPMADIGESARKSLDDLSASLQVMQAALSSAETMLDDEHMQAMPAQLTATLEQVRDTLASVSPGSSLYQRLDDTVLELQRTLKAVEDLVESVDDQPNRLLFPVKRSPDPKPGENP